MADRPSSRISRVLIERLESRRLLSAGSIGQQPEVHWFERPSTFGAPSAHRDFAFGREEVAPTFDASARTEGPSLAIIAAPDGHVVGFAPLFFGWHANAAPGNAGAADFHWAGHDAGHDATGDPAISRPSPLLHTPRLPSHESSDDTGYDSNGSEPSSTPSTPQSIGQVTGASGSSVVVVVVTQNSSPQIRVIEIPVGVRIEPKVAFPGEQVPAAVPQAQSVLASASSAPALERTAATVATNPFAIAPAVSALPPLKTPALSAVGRTAIEVAAVARAATTSDVIPAETEGAAAKTSEVLSTGIWAAAGERAQIAVAASGPAASVGAIRMATGWVRSAAAVIGRAFDAPASVSDVQTEYVVPAAYNFLRINPAMLFNDTVGRMIRESASLSPASASPNHVRAWAITGAVVAADTILVGYWHVNCRRKLRNAKKCANWMTHWGSGAASPV